MTVSEAINTAMSANRDMWFRPVTWRGSGEGLINDGDDGALLCVPSHRGGIPWRPRAKDLTCEWEVVTPDDVLSERDYG